MKIEQPLYYVVSSPFGPVAIVWWNAAAGPRVRQVMLCGRKSAAKAVQGKFPGARSESAAEIAGLGTQMQRFLKGQAIEFDLDMMGMDACGEFQRKVLLAEFGIPRGRVSTYGRLAEHIGVKGGGRAAGRALAENPFPIVIPCHRAVRADGALGGYQGGSGMKRALLEMEGVAFANKGKVLMKNVYY